MNIRWRGGLLYALAIIWLALTVTLAAWWLVFGLTQAEQLALPLAQRTMDTDRVYRMLIGEGSVLIGLLVAGGIALLVGIRYEQKRQAALESFFMAFTHELKTSLARVQLDAESLQEQLPGVTAPALDRLLDDSLRLQLQLENSLFFAQPDGRFFVERLSLPEQLSRAAADFPSLTVRVAGDASVDGDSRALQSVLRNVLHNAMVHGGATTVTVAIAREDTGRAVVRLTDNGCGASTEVTTAIAAPFASPAASGQTGFGLYVSRQLIQRMRGEMRWQSTAGAGFTVELRLPEAVA